MFKPTDNVHNWASYALSLGSRDMFQYWPRASITHRCITDGNKFLEWTMMSRKDALENMRSFFPTQGKASYSEGVVIFVSAGSYTPYLNLEIKKLPNLDTGWIKCSHPREVPEPIKLWAENQYSERIFDFVLDRDDPYYPSNYAVWEKYPDIVNNVYFVVVNRLSWFKWSPHKAFYSFTKTPINFHMGTYLAAGIELPKLFSTSIYDKNKTLLALLSYKNQLNKGIPDYKLDKVLSEPAPKPSKFKTYSDEFDKYSQPIRGSLERMVPSVGFNENEDFSEIFGSTINLFGGNYPIPRDMVYRQALVVVERMLKDLASEE